MAVELIEFTGKGAPNERWRAADLLIFAKSTRLEMSPGLLGEISRMPMAEKLEELDYISKTVPSSWEFADVTFLLTGVSRACAQQITRTRTGSYAMQSQRVTDMSAAGVLNPFLPESVQHRDFAAAVDASLEAYRKLVASGAAPQDARGILPINAHTNILCKYNLRTFVELFHARSSLRTQAEYHTLVVEMVSRLRDVWPWVDPFLDHPLRVAIEELEEIAAELDVIPGSGPGWRVAKAIDLIRKSK